MNKNKNNKIGILGGSFDPPHIGHLYISKIAIQKLKLNKLFWVVTKKNPLKTKPFLKVKKRINLAKKLTSKNKKIFIKYLEEQVKSKNSYDLLTYLRKKNKKSDLFFIIGADNLKVLHKWKKWKKIPKLAKIVIFPRKGYSYKLKSHFALKKLSKKDWVYINCKKINISSSLIRKFW